MKNTENTAKFYYGPWVIRKV